MNNDDTLPVNQVLENLQDFINNQSTIVHVSNQLKKTNPVEVHRNDVVEKQELWMLLKSPDGKRTLEFSIKDFFFWNLKLSEKKLYENFVKK